MVGPRGRVYVLGLTINAWYTLHVPLGAPSQLKVTFAAPVVVRWGRSVLASRLRVCDPWIAASPEASARSPVEDLLHVGRSVRSSGSVSARLSRRSVGTAKVARGW